MLPGNDNTYVVWISTISEVRKWYWFHKQTSYKIQCMSWDVISHLILIVLFARYDLSNMNFIIISIHFFGPSALVGRSIGECRLWQDAEK